MKKLVLDIACGETRCYSAPGKPCRFNMARKFGTLSFCLLWHDEDHKGHPLPMEEDEEGWLKRRPECLVATGDALSEPDPKSKYRYSAQRMALKDDRLFGKLHASDDGSQTICGKPMDQKWCIVATDFDGEVTCPKCLKEQR